MGLPMARRLHRAGFEVWGYDVKAPQLMGEFAARMLGSAQALASRCDVVLSVVRDGQQTEQLCFGPNGLLGSGSRLETLVLSSTLSPQNAQSLAARLPPEVCLLDAPMSGAPVSAEEGELSFMLAGNEARLASLMPVFQAMGSHFHQLGEAVGAGHTAKVLNNFSAAMSVAVTRQLLLLGESLGLSQAQLLAVMNSSSGQSWFSRRFEEIAWSREGYAADNTIGILEKDVGCFAEATAGLAGEELHNLRSSLLAALAALEPAE